MMTMNSSYLMNTHKKIGIWGLGIVGKSAIQFLASGDYQLSAYDKRILTQSEKEFLNAHHVTLYAPDQLESFLRKHELIVPSPGIDLFPYNQYAHKWLSEFDIFQNHYAKPIIAITGSVGKTTVTHLLSQALQFAGKKVITGGNIGTGCLDLLKDESASDLAILESSSFQLELCKTFAPFIAVWTNFYPNHLDRHKTVDNYFHAKKNILIRAQHAIVPLSMASLLAPFRDQLPPSFIFFTTQSAPEFAGINEKDSLFFIKNDQIVKWHNGHAQSIMPCHWFSDQTFQGNWLVIAIIGHLVGVDFASLGHLLPTIEIPDHRMEKLATINQIDFYNDSKATIPQATLAAVAKLAKKPIILIVGGVSKGVDRAILFEQLPKEIKHIVCFGSEAHSLCALAQHQGFQAKAFDSLTAAFAFSVKVAQPEDQVLFSPSGASFDLFANYQERGNTFRELVSFYAQKPSF
jgi:UDP-N-acetylmuramoylalanine--D-glutamate ligase